MLVEKCNQVVVVSLAKLFESTDFIVFDEPTSMCDLKHCCSVAEKSAILNFDCLCADCHRWFYFSDFFGVEVVHHWCHSMDEF